MSLSLPSSQTMVPGTGLSSTHAPWNLIRLANILVDLQRWTSHGNSAYGDKLCISRSSRERGRILLTSGHQRISIPPLWIHCTTFVLILSVKPCFYFNNLIPCPMGMEVCHDSTVIRVLVYASISLGVIYVWICIKYQHVYPICIHAVRSRITKKAMYG